MNNHSTNNTQFDNDDKSQTNLGFFKSIYKYLVDLIKRNPSQRNNDVQKKLNESINYYSNYYQNDINFYVENFSISKIGLINLLNDCYIISFLQILFHTPNFLDILKKYSYGKEETIINYLVKVSEYPFNVKYFYNLKQLLGMINPDYSKPWPNDSQEFGIDLINYFCSEIQTIKEPFSEDINSIHDLSAEMDFINLKKMVLKNYISTYQKNINEIEKLFLFNQIDIIYRENNQKPRITSNLHLELTLQKYLEHIDIENLIEQKYKKDNNNDIQKSNQMIIKSKIINLPEILIISINRVLNNEKINNTKLLFKESLDLKNYIDYDLFQDNNKKTSYHLYAINECVHSSRFSHYKCYIKLDNKWFIFDDDKSVEEFYGSFKYSPFIVGLFYKRDI